MNSQFESAKHTKIRAVKDELREEARDYLKSGKVGRRMAEIIDDNNAPGDIIEKIITNELSQSERRKIREMAGIKKDTTKTPTTEEQVENKRTYNMETFAGRFASRMGNLLEKGKDLPRKQKKKYFKEKN